MSITDSVAPVVVALLGYLLCAENKRKLNDKILEEVSRGVEINTDKPPRIEDVLSFIEEPRQDKKDHR